jgi:hypothetical protein
MTRCQTKEGKGLGKWVGKHFGYEKEISSLTAITESMQVPVGMMSTSVRSVGAYQ